MPIVQRYTVDRGRQSEMDKTAVGTATIEMFDTNHSLDPASGSTSYDPMTPVAIALENPVTHASSPIFRGHVARWGYKLYPTEAYGTATIECVDGMDVLNAAEMEPLSGGTGFGYPASFESLGNVYFVMADQVKHRIDKVLDQAGIAAGNREVFTGNVVLQEGTVYAPRTPAINAITDAADAEFPGGVSNFFVQKDGKYTFHGRLARFNPTDAQYHITTWKAGDLAAFGADASTAVITDLEYDRDKDRIINSALVLPDAKDLDISADIPGQRVEDSGSIAAYGTRSWSAENLEILSSWLTGNNAMDECRDVFATYYTSNYASPQTWVRKLQFKTVMPSVAYAGPTWALMCGVDISDRILLTAGQFVGEYYFVEGVHYTVEPGHGTDYLWVTLELDVSPAAYWTTLPS